MSRRLLPQTVATPEPGPGVDPENRPSSTGESPARVVTPARSDGLRHARLAEALAVPGEDVSGLAARLREWTIELDPRSQVERFLVEDAVVASWRLERCRRVEAAVLSRLVHAAAVAEELSRSEAVDALAAELADDPRRVARRLSASAAGCRWLLGQFRQVRETLVARGWLEPSERDRLLHLCGRRLADLFTDPFVYDVAVAATVSGAVTEGDVAAVQKVLGLEPSDREVERWEFSRRLSGLAEAIQAGDADAARALLLARIDDETAHIARRARQLAPAEVAALTGAVARAACDFGPDAQARLRYEEAHRRTLRNSLRDLEKVRKLVVCPVPPHDDEADPGPGTGALTHGDPTAESPVAGPGRVARRPGRVNHRVVRGHRGQRWERSAEGPQFRGAPGVERPDPRAPAASSRFLANRLHFEATCRLEDERRGYPVPDPVMKFGATALPRPPGSLGVPLWVRSDPR